MANLLRRGGEVTDYIQQAPSKASQAILDAGQRQQALMNEAFDPTGETLIRNPQAANQAAMNLLEGPLGFMPAGITAWHGTKKEFTNFDPKKSFGDLGVTWFSPEKQFAEKYAGKEGKVIPVEIEINKTFDFTNPKHIEALQKKASNIEIYDPIRGFMTLDKKIPDLSDMGNYKSAENPQLFNLIKKMGYDSVAVTEDGIKNIGVFNPNKTVSRKEILEEEVNKLK
jgi:hypothetical protein